MKRQCSDVPHSHLKWCLLTASLAVLPACGSESPTAESREPAPDTAVPQAAVAAGKFLKSADAVPGQYIVVLKDDRLGNASVPEAAQALALQHGARVIRTYSHALRGFVAQTHEAGARALAARSEVDYVVEDGKASLSGTQTDAPWSLDRIDDVERFFPRWGTYGYSTTGIGVHAYIIDSGIMTSHPDFGGRATGDFTAITDQYGMGDCNGHGTHVAGTVGGQKWGVAKNVRLHSVRVAGCDEITLYSYLIAGVDWVTANHIKPAVANISVTSPSYAALDDAVRNSIAAGVVYVVAAGNSNQDACNYSPGRVPAVITVGATDDTDARASFSNFGTCVDLFAPGMWVDSAALDGTHVFMSGTSQAAPHVAGVAALYLESNPSASPATVHTAVVYNAPAGKVTSAGSGSPTRMVHTTPLTACGKLSSGQALIPGRTLYSCAGNVRVTHQTDGNVVVYDRLGAIWNTQTWSTSTSTFIMQTDGNLVLYTGTGSPLWYTSTGGNPGAYLEMRDDCNLVMNRANGTRLWESHTACR
ncbi:S8 family serine peptidase [Pyxidicoccus caerfyrddinensis]|uniref:S8 family serine peptidase n=1 Tax=Pyxidicoccus caerfyrddinensis TaxID=2709663 RepID=UPI0013DC267A|nr:S8 family serine peptidase [Pyxidicoccus caerfyrddinensis]